MYIKCLDIFGFKSFADRVHIDFKPGITAIVGPNGSGKSNVADAIRWVLGEQSARSLRGGKMQDVIFSGTQQRKALSIAEVSLTIDNSAGALQIDTPEVKVTRKVLRSGENEYYINKSLVRFRDIIELFLDTGIGREGYSIIGQGKIDDILSVNPNERRFIFEQAAGIGKYKLRKEEAQVKLQKTRENILRIEDIIGELFRQLSYLKVQCERAHEYKALHQALKKAKINKYLYLYTNIQKKQKLLSQRLNPLLIHNLTSDLVDRERRLSFEKEKFYNINYDVEKLRDLILEKSNLNQKLLGEIELYKEKLHRIAIENNSLDTDNVSDLKVIASKKSDILKFESEKTEKLELVRFKSTEAREKEQLLNRIKAQSSSDIKSYEHHQADIKKLNDEYILLKTEIAKSEMNYVSLTERLKYRRDELAAKSNLLQNVEDGILMLETEINSTQTLMQVLSSDKISEESNLTNYSKYLKECELLANQTRQKLESTKTKLDILKNLHETFEGYSFGVKSILEAKRLKKFTNESVIGVIADLIEVNKEYRAAIEAALGSGMQYIVTEKEEDVKVLIDYLSKNKFGRATFLPLSSVKSRVLNKDEAEVAGFKGVIGIASQIAKYDEKYRNAIEFLLGRTVLTETLDQAVSVSRMFGYMFKVVTIRADVINPGGSITGGEHARKAAALVGRKQEIDDLNLEYAELKKTEFEIKNKIDEIVNSLNICKVKLSETNDKMRTEEINLAVLTQKHIGLCIDRSKRKAETASAEDEIKSISEQLKNNFKGLNTLKEKAAILESDKANLLVEMQSAEDKFIYITDQKLHLEKSIADLNHYIASLYKDVSSISDKIILINNDLGNLIESTKQRENRISANKEIAVKLASDSRLRSIESEIVSKEIATLYEKLTDYDTDKKAAADQMMFLESKIAKLRSEIDNEKEVEHSLKLKISKLEAEGEHVERRLWEEFKLTYGTSLEYLDPSIDINELEKQISVLENSLNTLGEVNLTSIDDYEELKKRFDSMQSQKEDLLNAERDLNKIIHAITDSMKIEFCTEFKIINEHFNYVFSRLFGGGKAKLILEDESNPLECGIEIAVQPPGKKLQSMSLLSGGEKALTASAILLAIVKRKPALFCVLDEIDAVLDESNLFNLATFLREFSAVTQFIVITHRKITMEMCDILYGVLMEEKGVSKMVSVKLQDVAV